MTVQSQHNPGSNFAKLVYIHNFSAPGQVVRNRQPRERKVWVAKYFKEEKQKLVNRCLDFYLFYVDKSLLMAEKLVRSVVKNG